ncbi:BC1881 family protein [Clostridium botulinum]|uniref:BC1881 family protein n=1 Tax=Clostridium botulinum TaxID=1491 RepID=A0A6G4CLI0_CLOBO|nr:BC1881 family protein [Clostridium botulinum]NEZ99806.1 BC1881 family protein [Clostridium botulinum]NFA31252.1 BC1881 family protein [Clostridium botulinum]NFB07817.1 BC1881 family protein [Clostridium botulinum]
MGKKIKTTDLNLNVSTGTILYVDIDIFRFLYDQEIFCITVQFLDGENYEFFEEVELPEGKVIVNHDDLRKFALNWIFNNVEIVKEAPEVSAQEQLKKLDLSQASIKDLADELVKRKNCVTRLRPEPYEKYSISMENNGTIVDLGPATILKIID